MSVLNGLKRIFVVKTWIRAVRNTYEMIMAGCLCVNVIWMAFELQFHGSKSAYAAGQHIVDSRPLKYYMDYMRKAAQTATLRASTS